ncbi:hypothetical protein ERJ75_001364500 [Trypanosoma vivax]|uniref:Uncharacterized protein n=1 Tax=Trypanosoma vivax (strain Y486) TaxID=1055687 RepID=G0UCM8_TRYVY|nr:hypothetical protein TRVL_09148 [Trypanosoma vivax]KAH8608111.1 hypothetical protein ERJ75_001364500 [Trypanosoma vivax]CCC53588.1 conserved hypothetical protein [Trypanosoma vivax Y486]
MDDNPATLQECIDIQKLSCAVDELIGWDFVASEKEAILTDVEGLVAVLERELGEACVALAQQQRRCALIPIDPADATVARSSCAAVEMDPHLMALWRRRGSALARRYASHLSTYERLRRELLDMPPLCVGAGGGDDCEGAAALPACADKCGGDGAKGN